MYKFLIPFLVFWYVAESLCLAVNSYSYGFTNFGKTKKAFIFSFFFCPIVLIMAMAKKKMKISKRGLRMAAFYPLSLLIFISLYMIQIVLNFLANLFEFFGSRAFLAYEVFIMASGKFFNKE